MTFNRIALKMLKANIRRYLLYFLCSSFSIMIFFVYMSLYTNDKLMHSSMVSSSIVSMLIAPTIAVALFSVFFIIYSHLSFIKSRKNEFGLFMVLGMSGSDIGKIILFENIIIASISLLVGVVFGVPLSKAFYLLVIKIIGVSGIPFGISLKSFIYTLALYSFIYAIMILNSTSVSRRYEIIKLLKDNKKEDKNSLFRHPVFGIIGFILLGAGIIDVIFNFSNDSSVVLCRSLSCCFAGVYLVVSQMINLLDRLLRRKRERYHRNMIFLANMKYTFGQTKKILFLNSVFVFITIFFCGISFILRIQAEDMAIKYNPYQIAYAEIFGVNSISDLEVKTIANKNNNAVVVHESMEFLFHQNMIIVSDETLNQLFGTEIYVNEGCYDLLYQVVPEDGYYHDTPEISEFQIQLSNQNITYRCQDVIKRVLFSNIKVLTNGPSMILNAKDYSNIKSNIDGSGYGEIHLLNFQNWKNTQPIVNDLEKQFRANHMEEKDNYLLIPNSRISDYLQSLRAASFMLFLCTFVGILFFASSCTLLHFKLQTEMAREQVKYKKLYKIGITYHEVSRIMKKELKVLFFIPLAIGSILALLFDCALLRKMGNVESFLLTSGIICGIYLLIQILYYIYYKKYYVHAVCRNFIYEK